MAKVIDVTEKLSFDSNPRLRIQDVELETRANARTRSWAAGYSFGIYCNQDWYNNVLDVVTFDYFVFHIANQSPYLCNIIDKALEATGI